MLRVEKSTSRLFVCKSPQCFIASKLNRQAVRIFFRQPRASRNNILFYFGNFTLPWIINKKSSFIFTKIFPNVAIPPKIIYFASNLFLGMRLDVDWAREKFVSPCFDYFLFVVVSQTVRLLFSPPRLPILVTRTLLCAPFRKAFLTFLSKTETQQRSFEHHPMFISNDVKCFGHCSQIWMDSSMTLDPRAPYLLICSHVHV